MRLLLLIAICFTLFTSCSSSGTKSRWTTLRETGDSIVLDIDYNTRFMTKALFCFADHNGKEILSFEGVNKIQFYNLEDGALLHTTTLQEEGPDGVGIMYGHFPLSIDSVYITRRNVPELYLVNRFGEVLTKYSYPQDEVGELCTHSISSSIVYTPLIKAGGKLLLSQLLLYGGRTTGDLLEKTPLSVMIDEQTCQVTKSVLCYPRLWDRADEFSFSEYSRIFDGKRFVYSFFWDENIHVINAEHTGRVEVVPAKSTYISALNKGMKKAKDFQKGMQMSVETAKYGNLIHDPYRNVYYRFAYPQTELGADEDLQSALSFKKGFSIILLNENLETIGETLFPDGKYVPSLFFVAKEGLYISNNHIKNPNFSEDQLTFQRLALEP